MNQSKEFDLGDNEVQVALLLEKKVGTCNNNSSAKIT